MKKTVSYSRISLYRECPQAYNYSYVEKIVPKRPSVPMFFGKDFHSLLEARAKDYSGKYGDISLGNVVEKIQKQFNSLPSIHQEMLGQDYIINLMDIFNDYHQVYSSVDSKKSSGILGVEQRFELPLPVVVKGDRYYINGVVDLKEEDEDEHILITDHKTFTKMPDAITMAMNTQTCIYAKAIQMTDGIIPTKMIWDYVRSKPADQPIWLEKSGRFSFAANSNITPYSFRRALVSRGLQDDKDCYETSKSYALNIENFFKRIVYPIVPEMVNSIWQDFIATTKDLAVNGSTNKVKHVSWRCQQCSYKELCFTEFTGGDVKYTKDKDFEKKKEDKDINAEDKAQ